MTDQTPNPTADVPETSSFLSEEERQKIQNLTVRSNPRYKADAQSQALLERALRWFRVLVMRRDGKRWRVAKSKVLAYLIAVAALVSFWNYWPKPKLENAFQSPSISFPSNATKPEATIEPPISNPLVSAPPKLPTPRLETPKITEPISSLPAKPSYNPYEQGSSSVPSYSPPVNTSSVGSREPPISSPSFPSNFGTDEIRNPLPTITPKRAFSDSSQQKILPVPTPLIQRKLEPLRTPEALIAAPKSELTEAIPLTSSEVQNSGNEPLAVSRDTQQKESEAAPVGVLIDTSPTRTNNANSPASSSSPGTETNVSGVLFDKNAGNTTSSTRATPSLYPPGTRLGAKLSVGIIAVQGQDSPVIATLEDGSMAFGKASLTNSGRVQISILEVSKQNTSSSVNGSALSPDGFPGLVGELREEGADIVAKLWNAGLNGVSSFVQGLARSSTTTVAQGVTMISQQCADLGLSILGSLAQAFLTPPTQQQTVKFVELKPDTPFQVLFLPSQK
jgi:hypothetical protein